MKMLLRMTAQTFNPNYQRYASSQWSAEGLLKLNVNLGSLNVYLENLILI